MNEESLSQLYLKDTAFQNLMQRRIFNVLLVASPYDAFMMEEDGRVDEQLYNEYVSLNLSSPPRIVRVANIVEALGVMEDRSIDLVIAMPGMDISETFSESKEIKKRFPEVPIVVLTPFSKSVSRRLAQEDLSAVDYVFSWLGNVDLLLAIIKLLEDKRNADNDVLDVGVQMILMVEDSVRFYSSILPHLYKFLLKQSVIFSTEALNEHEKMLRMRGRPKVILARDYEEAVALYEKFADKMLGVITDVSFMREGEKDPQAGLRFARYLREHDPYLPIIVESTESENRGKVGEFDGVFLDKTSKKLPVDLGKAIMGCFGFGDFSFKDPETGEEILRVSSVNELQKRMFDIPSASLLYHARRNDISRWLYSRAMFPIADVIKYHRFNSIEEAPAVKRLFFDLIVKYRKMKNRGVVAEFRKDRFDYYSNFARIGQGSLGGKGRGLAFIDSIIKKHPECDNFMGVAISIPRTVVVCTDIFDEFMADNDLYPLALSNVPDEEILEAFLKARLPERVRDDLLALTEVVDRPLAVRSSSLLEDSHYQPFAGVYSTYMIPHVDDAENMRRLLTDAIKGVYASVFYAESKAYMTATSNVIDQEKMAVIIQEVVGKEYDGYYFPSFAGVGRSLNYYPLNEELPEEGVAEVAVGLGKYIVDGGRALRFSPKYPHKVLQTSTLDLALRDTQRELYCLSLKDDKATFKVDDSFNLTRASVQDFKHTDALRLMVSTYDVNDQMMRDNATGPGRKVVTFANILRDGAFPLADAVNLMLTEGQQAMQRPVEIEFAGNIDNEGVLKGRIYWLQIRPIIDRKEDVDEEMMKLPESELLLKSTTALGHGTTDNVRKILYVRPEAFSSLKTPLIAAEIAAVNRRFVENDEGYVLIGPGRWGSSDSALGIPVKWADIAGARLVVETALENYRIEPSQGTHFFQNLTSFGVGYFTINPFGRNDYFDVDYLDGCEAEYESEYLRLVAFDEALLIGIDGKKGVGVVRKPNKPAEAGAESVRTDVD
ncbi:MAG: phosphoenolpyruvate synthase [Muribaculaceae bacterium]|nr:phosphoenolpyruvate synthase [Muribaculaceae bacterium]